MGIRISDVPGQDATRIEWWEDGFCLQQLDLDVRLPVDRFHQAEKLLNYYYGEWIFDQNSKFHKPLTKEDLSDEWRTRSGWPFTGPHKRSD